MGEWDWINQDKANFGKDTGPISSSRLVKVGGNNFANMRDASQIDTLKAAAPAFHGNIDHALKASGTVRAPDPVVEAAMYRTQQQKREILGFTKGAPVKHLETGKKLTILQASVGHTKKTRTPVHKVVDKEGNVWLEKESKLKLRM
jgi:hypothetical protein